MYVGKEYAMYILYVEKRITLPCVYIKDSE